ncbi:putative membrane protein [Escherichia coli FRIK1985]|nr:putative membrane protein [Escherichia coli FRIK1985]
MQGEINFTMCNIVLFLTGVFIMNTIKHIADMAINKDELS